jgi:16S rRNA (cytidine1402-2'-O)-methyltransferase
MTPRAVETLSAADMIAAEDTRTSKKLLTHFNLKTPLFSCHAHNEANKGAFFVNALLEGKNIALISDAGTPCISDPGHILISRAAEAGINIVAVSGACAVSSAMSISGFEASRFAFIGFLPRKKKEQEEILKKLATWDAPVVFYESPKRIKKTLAFFHEKAPTAAVCLCNDLTKKFERSYRGTPGAVLAELEANPAAEKGEYTCVIYSQSVPEADTPNSAFSLEGRLADIIIRENVDMKTAVSFLHAQESALQKKEIYAAGLNLKAKLGR